jgi:hypothetical protein
MHRLHIVPRVEAPPVPAGKRGAKIIALEARRKARLERLGPKPQPSKDAA